MFAYPDDIFNQILYQQKVEKNGIVPAQFLHSTTASDDGKYVSPFRSQLSENKQLRTENLRNETFGVSMRNSQYQQTSPKSMGFRDINPKRKYARDISFPESLTENEEKQRIALEKIMNKEENLKIIKESQKIYHINEKDLVGDYLYIEQPIDIFKVPKIPYDFYSNVSPRKLKIRNPKANTLNPEEIVYFTKLVDGKKLTFIYSKEIFDNIQYDVKNHEDYLENLRLKNGSRYRQKLDEYNVIIQGKQQQINEINKSMKLIIKKNDKINSFMNSNQSKRYLQNINIYSERKNKLYKEIEMIKRASRRIERQGSLAVVNPPTAKSTRIVSSSKLYEITDNDNGIDPKSGTVKKSTNTGTDNTLSDFEYLTEEEIKYV